MFDIIKQDQDKKEIQKDFITTTFDLVNKSGLVKKDDLEKLTEIRQELADTFRNVQMFRTRTEMEISVLNDLKYPTPDSKYWQATREQNVMFQELVLLSYEYRKNEVRIKILQRDLKELKDPLYAELKKIEIAKKTFMLRNQERTAQARIEELLNWHEIKEREAKNITGSIKDCDAHQLISYTKRWINQSIAMGNSGSPSEKQNLLGQLRSGITSCIKKDLLEKVLEEFPGEIKNKIRREYGLPKPKN